VGVGEHRHEWRRPPLPAIHRRLAGRLAP
jgi:hypothetical protein